MLVIICVHYLSSLETINENIIMSTDGWDIAEYAKEAHILVKHILSWCEIYQWAQVC